MPMGGNQWKTCLIGTTQISGSVCCRHGYNGLFNWCYGSIPPEPIVVNQCHRWRKLLFLHVLPHCLKPIPPNFPFYLKCWSNPNGGRSPAKTVQLRKQMARSCRGIKDDFCEGARSGASCQSFWMEKIQELPALPAFSTKSSDFFFA